MRWGVYSWGLWDCTGSLHSTRFLLRLLCQCFPYQLNGLVYQRLCLKTEHLHKCTCAQGPKKDCLFLPLSPQFCWTAYRLSLFSSCSPILRLVPFPCGKGEGGCAMYLPLCCLFSWHSGKGLCVGPCGGCDHVEHCCQPPLCPSPHLKRMWQQVVWVWGQCWAGITTSAGGALWHLSQH